MNEYEFTVDIRGTAGGTVKANSTEEAKDKVLQGDYEDMDSEWDYDLPWAFSELSTEDQVTELGIREVKGE